MALIQVLRGRPRGLVHRSEPRIDTKAFTVDHSVVYGPATGNVDPCGTVGAVRDRHINHIMPVVTLPVSHTLPATD